MAYSTPVAFSKTRLFFGLNSILKYACSQLQYWALYACCILNLLWILMCFCHFTLFSRNIEALNFLCSSQFSESNPFCERTVITSLTLSTDCTVQQICLICRSSLLRLHFTYARLWIRPFCRIHCREGTVHGPCMHSQMFPESKFEIAHNTNKGKTCFFQLPIGDLLTEH